MQFNKKEIEEILNSIKPNLNTKNIDPQLSHIFFTKQNILSFNGKVAINHLFETDFEFSVDGQKLSSIIAKIPGEKINIDLKGKNLSIKGERKSEATLSIVEDISVLEQADFLNKKMLKWNKLPKGFNTGLNLCRFSVSKDLTKPELSCICIKDNLILSSDNFRISKWNLEDKIDSSFLIPGNAANILSGFEVIAFNIKGSWIHFKTASNAIISCLTINADFPDVEEFFDIKGTSLTFPEGCKELIEDVSIMLDADFKQDEFISVEFKEKDSCIYFSGTGNLGKFTKAIPMKNKIKKDFGIKINPGFLNSVLDKETKIIVNQELSRALFENDNFQHIISLIEE